MPDLVSDQLNRESLLKRLVKLAREHADYDESMDPCDGNPCSLRDTLDALGRLGEQ